MGQSHNNTIRGFDTETNCWMNTPPAQLLPERRDRYLSFTYNRELQIFGGCKGYQYFNNLWIFKTETFSWRKVEAKGKGPLRIIQWSSCMVGDRIFIFRGYCHVRAPALSSWWRSHSLCSPFFLPGNSLWTDSLLMTINDSQLYCVSLIMFLFMPTLCSCLYWLIDCVFSLPTAPSGFVTCIFSTVYSLLSTSCHLVWC